MSLIASGLLTPSLCLGKGKSFVDAVDGTIQLVSERPKNGVISRIENVFDERSGLLVQELQFYSAPQLQNLATNLTYLAEKLNRESSLEINVSDFFKVMAGSLLGFNTFCIGKSIGFCMSKSIGYGLLAFSIGFSALPVLKNIYFGVAGRKREVTQSDSRRFSEKITNIILPIVNQKIAESKSSLMQEQRRAIQLAAIDKLFTTTKILRVPTLEDVHTYRKVITFVQTMRKEGYYTFLHGQSLKNAMISKFLSKVLARLEPARDVADFQFLRFTTKKDVEECESHKRSTKAFLLSQYCVILDFIKYYDELISVTVNPLDNTPTETAFYYWMCNGNVNQDVPKIVIGKLRKVLTLSDESCAAIQDTFDNIMRLLHRTLSIRSGNLVAICVPKNRCADKETCIAYRSFPWGIPRHPFQPHEIVTYLDRDWVTSESCQARLLTTQLVPENQVKTYHFNTLSASENEECDVLLNTLTDRVMQDVNRNFA